MHKLPLYLLIVLALAAFPAPAAAAQPSAPYDASYAVNGTLRLPAYGSMSRIVQRCEFASGDTLAIAGRFGGSGKYDTKPVMRLATALVSDFSSTRRRTANVTWRGQTIPRGHRVLATDFAKNGSLAYATAPLRGTTTRIDVFRTRRDGRRAKSFDRDGRALIQVDQRAKVDFVRVKAMGDRGMLVAIAYADNTMDVVRLSTRGQRMTGWADGGVLRVPAITMLAPEQEWIAFETLGGGLMIGVGNGAPLMGDRRSGLLMLAPDGVPFETFGDRGRWFPPSNGPHFGSTPYTAAGHSLEAQANSDSSFGVLYADQFSDGLGIATDYRIATLDAIGQTVWNSPVAGTLNDGGDGGLPDSYPLGFAHLGADGGVFAFGVSFYGPSAGTFRGAATRWDGGAVQAAVTAPITTASEFAADDFEVTADGKHVYACGSIGQTSSKTKPPWQRKSVAIRRIKL